MSTIFLRPRVLEEWNPLTFQEIMRILMMKRDGPQIAICLRSKSMLKVDVLYADKGAFVKV